MLSASTPSLRLGFSDSDFIFILPRVPPLTRLRPGLPYAAPHARGSELRTSYIVIRTFKLRFITLNYIIASRKKGCPD